MGFMIGGQNILDRTELAICKFLDIKEPGFEPLSV